jgi:galactokinase/mevalonate kinase-like predicted kinase
MKLTLTTKKDGGNTLVTLTGTKKKLRDTDGVVRGKSSYGDPSTTDHFDESLEEAISRDKTLSKNDISGVENYLSKSYINKKTLSQLSFDDDAIFHAKTGKTIFTSKDYIGKMTIDDLIKALEKKVK